MISHPKIILYPVMILEMRLVSLMADQPEKPHICVADDEDGKCNSETKYLTNFNTI